MLRLGGVLGSAAAGMCWLVALFLPWTARGTLSTASLLDAVELVRRGTVDAVVPQGAAAVLLVPAVAGIVLIGLVGLRGRVVGWVRSAALAIGAAASVVLAWRLVGADTSRLGPGAWLATIGVVAAILAAAALLTDRLRSPTPVPGNH